MSKLNEYLIEVAFYLISFSIEILLAFAIADMWKGLFL